MNHTAGMAMLPEHGTMAGLADWDGMCRALAAMSPFPEPGSERHYHAITYAWLLGETIHRADGRDCARIIREEISDRLGLDGMFFGISDAEASRVQDAEKAPPQPAAPVTPPAAPLPPDLCPAAIIPPRAIPSWVCPLEDLMNRDDVRRSCVPASTGIMNARSIAKQYAALVGNGVDGIRLVNEATMDEATRNALIPGETRARWGLGYGLSGPDSNPGAVFGHGGYGGSNGFADRRHDLAVGFTKAHMGGGGDALYAVIRECLGIAD